MPSILRYVPTAAFDDAETRLLGDAFDAACKELHDTGQPEIVHEVIAKRIIAAANQGERDPIRLRDAGLAALGCEKGALAPFYVSPFHL